MPVFFSTEVNIPFTANSSWNTVDLSSGYGLPSNAAVVFLKLKNNAGFSYTVIAQSGDGANSFSTEGGHGGSLRDGGMSYQPVKLGTGKTIQILAAASAGGQVSLYGYLTTDEVAALDTMSFFTVPVTGWNTVDLSSYLSTYGISGSAYGVLIQAMSVPDTGTAWAALPNTSPLTYTAYVKPSQAYNGSTVVQLKQNKLQVYSGSRTLHKFYIVGFLKKDLITSYDSPVDLSSLTGTYPTFANISTLPANAFAGIYNITQLSAASINEVYGIRGSGDSQIISIGADGYGAASPAVPVGTGQVIQATKNGGTNNTIWEMGYWHTPPGGSLFFGVNF